MRKIYILHGWTYSTDKWEPFLTSLQKSGVESVMVKIPGLTTPLNDVWTIDDYVEWLKKSLDKEKGKVVLLGHSNGGRIILAFAVKYPAKVKNIILIDSAGIYHDELPIRIKRFVFGKLAKLGKGIRNIKFLRKLFYVFVQEHDYQKADPVLRQTMHNLITYDISVFLETIINSTTIIWGRNDKITPLSDGEYMHTLIKNSSLYIIDTARHSPQFTNTEEVAAIVIKAIK